MRSVDVLAVALTVCLLSGLGCEQQGAVERPKVPEESHERASVPVEEGQASDSPGLDCRGLSQASVAGGTDLAATGLSDPDQNRIIRRTDMRNGREPILWYLQLPLQGSNRDDPRPYVTDTYFVEVHAVNTGAPGPPPELDAYFWGDRGDVLQIEWRWLGAPAVVASGQSVVAHFDTDGYTPRLLSSAARTQSKDPPTVQLAVVSRWRNSPGVVCAAQLPAYPVGLSTTKPLKFAIASTAPAIENRTQVETRSSVWSAGWGPPALKRIEGDQQATYRLYSEAQ